MQGTEEAASMERRPQIQNAETNVIREGISIAQRFCPLPPATALLLPTLLFSHITITVIINVHYQLCFLPCVLLLLTRFCGWWISGGWLFLPWSCLSSTVIIITHITIADTILLWLLVYCIHYNCYWKCEIILSSFYYEHLNNFRHMHWAYCRSLTLFILYT